MTSFVLLDDCGSGPSQPRSRLYSDFVHEHSCHEPSELQQVWERVCTDTSRGLHCVVLADYDWGQKLLSIRQPSAKVGESGRLTFLIFRTLERLDVQQVDDRLALMDGGEIASCAGIADIQSSVSRLQFESDIERIHDLIRAGETYQVNYTYRLRGRTFGSPVALYRRLRARQPVHFGALIALPTLSSESTGDQKWVLSCSPELFVRNDKGLLTTRPMKGTAPRDADTKKDEQNARWLEADEKNRAENLMIVDLLRNDLGRISKTGSVEVPTLFSVETYRTVHQMTSTVRGRLRDGVGFPQVLRALFPCGSITGAPKHHTMQLIASLERSPRRLYTGAIGWIDQPSHPTIACPDFCMSVAIRTVLLGTQDEAGGRDAELGVGGGIVLDSQVSSEFDETLTKALFATGVDPGFKLFETMRASRDNRIANLGAHLRRLEDSARTHRFKFEAERIEDELRRTLACIGLHGPLRLRLELSHNGVPTVSASALSPLTSPITYLISECARPALERALCAHKTTARETYDESIRRAEALGAFDTLFLNADGYLTEGARTNVFLRVDGRWFTPALECGLLPGTYRARLLRRRGWASEALLRLSDLARADCVLLCNALRGTMVAVPHATLGMRGAEQDHKRLVSRLPTHT